MQKNPHLSFIPHKKLNAPRHHEMLPVDKNSECEQEMERTNTLQYYDFITTKMDAKQITMLEVLTNHAK